MIYLLLLISFFIHLVTFIVIKQLRDRYNKLQNIEANVEQQKSELEDTLAVYLADVKQENETFIKKLDQTEIKKDTEQRIINETDEKISDRNDYSSSGFSTIESREKVNDTVEHSLTSHVLHLKEKGYSEDEIAKKLDKGKTEIELLLKFYQNK